MTNLTIHTAQNVNLNYKVVNIGERLLAFLIDLFIFFAYLYVWSLVMESLGYAMQDNWTLNGLGQLFLLPIMFYSFFMHIAFQGQTLGKMALRIKVVKADGRPAEWSDFMIRWLMRVVDIWMFAGSVGFLFIIFSDKNQRLGDLAAGTVVISTKNKIQLNNTILEEVSAAYVPVYPQVINLTDKDVRLIKETFQLALKSQDYVTLRMLREKVEQILETNAPVNDREYIEIVLKDYNYLTFNM